MDLGGSEPLNLCLNLIRGETVKGDLLKVDFETSKISLLATVIAWGYATRVIESSEAWRGCLGTSRYTLCGAREVFCAGGPWSMANHRVNKAQFISDLPESVSKNAVVQSNPYKIEPVRETAAVPIILGEIDEESDVRLSEDFSLMRPSMSANKLSESAFDKNGELRFSNFEDQLLEEKQSRLGTIINPEKDVSWESIDLDSLCYFMVTTHECRRMGTKDILAPFSRINDGKTYICGFRHASKIEMLLMMSKVAQGAGKQVDMEKFFHQEIKQIKLEPSKFFL